jgi:hypothetical protein
MMKKITAIALCMVAFFAQSEGSSFKGFHVGVHGGWSQVKAGKSVNSGDIGVHVGYDWAIGNTVVGLESYVDYNSFSVEEQGLKTTAPLHFGFSGRLGYDLNGFLVYTSVGMNFSKVKITEQAAGSTSISTKTLPVGLGVEKAFNNIRAGVFFNHHFKVGDKSFSANQAGVRLSYKF